MFTTCSVFQAVPKIKQLCYENHTNCITTLSFDKYTIKQTTIEVCSVKFAANSSYFFFYFSKICHLSFYSTGGIIRDSQGKKDQAFYF